MANQRHPRLLTGITAIVTAVSILAASVPALTPVKAEASVNYKKLYGKYLKHTHPDFYEKVISDSGAAGAYIYLDNDNIPELYINNNVGSGYNCYLLTIRGGKVKQIEPLPTDSVSTGISSYQKKTGKYRSFTGDSIFSGDSLVRYKNGKATTYDKTTRGNNSSKDDYYVNGKEVSKKRYNKECKKIDRITKNWTKIKEKSFKSLGLLHYMK